ncbi:Dexamethasone-induced Ras-related protein 1 [Triplophysa tibetana]|uniref:Dexamethasone-induced Ras-related protein 1 n=1 Tax=Triplophysa tibetana TaxID=1572043 RepID=A0A5A9PP73_9TELE|nr:Dexamethasone-induced Ras-related protein 1 [Triplophysa tibetana]
MSLSVRENRTVRFVFLGAAGVGKTALITRFLHDRFDSKYTRTVEELHALEYDTDDARVRIEILDTSGSYAFPAMRALCMRTGDAFALVYAADEPGSLQEVQRLREEILEVKGEHFTGMTVIENKGDLGCRSRQATAEVMRTVEKDWSAGFVETSARTGENVIGLFRDLLQQVKLPSRVSPALRRRSQTMTIEAAGTQKMPTMKKNNSCILS